MRFTYGALPVPRPPSPHPTSPLPPSYQNRVMEEQRMDILRYFVCNRDDLPRSTSWWWSSRLLVPRPACHILLPPLSVWRWGSAIFMMTPWVERRTSIDLTLDFRWGYTRITLSDTPSKVCNTFSCYNVMFFATRGLEKCSTGARSWFEKPMISIKGFHF